MVTTVNNWNSTEVFPSPTGVNYYEYAYGKVIMDCELFPSPTGVNYYELYDYIDVLEMENEKLFPSPTGVNYYEL